MGATVAYGRRQHDTQRRVRQGPPAPPPAPSSVEAVTSSGLGRCLPRSRQPARRLPARRGPGARLCHSSATSGLARHAVVAVPAGPRRPPLPARAAPRLGPARSSAGAWPHQDARRRPRTGTPSETLQPISRPSACWVSPRRSRMSRSTWAYRCSSSAMPSAKAARLRPIHASPPFQARQGPGATFVTGANDNLLRPLIRYSRSAGERRRCASRARSSAAAAP
jgi:hypothetical protein